MRISRQIGWSTEANLIYELIRQTERLSITYGNKQPGFRVPISKPLSLSTESNLYYEWLRSLCKFTAQVANCCTTTTSTTLTPQVCYCYTAVNTTFEQPILVAYVPCGGTEITFVEAFLNTPISFCAVENTVDPGSAELIISTTSCTNNGDCTPACFCYTISNLNSGPLGESIEVYWVDCSGTPNSNSISPQATLKVCAQVGSVYLIGGEGIISGGIVECSVNSDCTDGCICYSVTNNFPTGEGNPSINIGGTDCNDQDYSIILEPGQSAIVCSKQLPISDYPAETLISTDGNPCITSIDCGL